MLHDIQWGLESSAFGSCGMSNMAQRQHDRLLYVSHVKVELRASTLTLVSFICSTRREL